MSGPKVVRTVTREEILGICHGQLARVDAALAEWTRIGRRNNCIDEEAVAASVKRRDALAALRRIDHALNVGCPALKRIALLGAAAASIVSWISDYGVEISAARWVVNAWFNTFSMTCSKPLSVVTSFSCSFETSPHQQMRAVALEVAGRAPDPARDRDAETMYSRINQFTEVRVGGKPHAQIVSDPFTSRGRPDPDRITRCGRDAIGGHS